MGEEQSSIQRFNLQYICVDNDKIWFVACQLEHNFLLYFDLKSEQVKYVACIASYSDINRRYSYCVLGKIGKKIIIAPYQSLDRFFVEYDLVSGTMTRKEVPCDYYACTTYREGKEEFIELVKYGESLFFFSSRRKAIIEYNAALERYYCHKELEDFLPDDYCGMNRHSVIRNKELVYIPIVNSNIIVEYNLCSHTGHIYKIPFEFKAGMIAFWNNKFVISSMESYDLVLWDKAKESFSLVKAVDIVSRGEVPRLLPHKDILLLAPWTPEGIWCFVDKTGQIRKYGKNKKTETFCDVVYTDYDSNISLCYRFPEAILEIYDLEKNSYKEMYLRCNDEKYIKDLISLDCDSYIDEGYMPLDIFLKRII